MSVIRYKLLILIVLIFNNFQAAQTDIPLILPCAGYGTRMLPATKSIPKGLLHIFNKPAIQFLAEEALCSGIKQCVLITKSGQDALFDYFDTSFELSTHLKHHNKLHLTRNVQKLSSKLDFCVVRQPYMGGTGHAVNIARDIIGDRFFCVAWPDIIILGENDLLGTMINLSKLYNASVIGVTEIPMDEVGSHGVVVLGKSLGQRTFEITDIIEKPKPEESPSNIINAGRFVVSPKVFDSLKVIPKMENGELGFPHALKHMLDNGERIIAYKAKGVMHDIGRPLSWFKTVLHYGLNQPEYKQTVLELISEAISNN